MKTVITFVSVIVLVCMFIQIVKFPSWATDLLQETSIALITDMLEEDPDVGVDTTNLTDDNTSMVEFDETITPEVDSTSIEDSWFEETTGAPEESIFVEETSYHEETTGEFESTETSPVPDYSDSETIDTTVDTDPIDTTTEPLETTVASSNALTNNVTRDDGAWFWPVGSGYTFSDCAGCTDWCHNAMRFGHNGVDFLNNTSYVYAARDGVLYYYNDDTYNNGRGITAIIEHEYTSTHSYYSIYQHLSGNPSSASGTRVAAGDAIAVSGKTGTASGPHLHFSIIIAPVGQGRNMATDLSLLGAVENKGWIYNDTIPEGGGMIVTNPKYPTESVISGKITADDRTAFEAHPGSVTYVFDASLVREVNAEEDYNTLTINTDGGTFGDPAGYALDCTFSSSASYSSTTAVVKTAPHSVIYLESTGCGIAVNFMGAVVDHINNSPEY